MWPFKKKNKEIPTQQLFEMLFWSEGKIEITTEGLLDLIDRFRFTDLDIVDVHAIPQRLRIVLKSCKIDMSGLVKETFTSKYRPGSKVVIIEGEKWRELLLAEGKRNHKPTARNV